MRNNQTRKVRTSSIILLFLMFLLCVVISAAAMTIYRLPEAAADRFGPASNALTRTQKVHYAFQLFIRENDLFAPIGAEARAKKFEIQLGEPVYSVTSRLEQEGFVPDGEAVRIYLVYAGLDTRVQAGGYRFDEAFTVLDLARRLEDPTPGEVRFVVLPGWRLEEIAAVLPTSGLKITPAQFLERAYAPPVEVLPNGWKEGDSLEGALAAGEYTFPRDISLDEFLGTMVSRSEEILSVEIVNGLNNQGLSVKEGMILASIVQKEAVVVEEQTAIASVFLNRLRIGMKLDTDPTVQYAVGNSRDPSTWWVNPISAEDLRVDSPYNTYIYAGLPPSPICAVNESAIRAVAHPESTPYYYFRAGCAGDGRHLFAESYEEHLQNACE
jgi:UPF0755 protein